RVGVRFRHGGAAPSRRHRRARGRRGGAGLEWIRGRSDPPSKPACAASLSSRTWHGSPCRRAPEIIMRGKAYMKRTTRMLIPSAISIAMLATPTFAQVVSDTSRESQQDETQSKVTELSGVMVVAQRASRVSNGATNLDLDIKDTPQSISVVTREQMDQFGA